MLWNTPILNHFHRVGRTLVTAAPEAPFPSDLPRSAIFGSALEMIQFINVLLGNLGVPKFFIQKTEITFREKRCVAGMPSVSFMDGVVEHPVRKSFSRGGPGARAGW